MPDELIAVYGCQDPQRAGDVVFVHGLNGNPYGYWAYQGKRDCWWPEWLGEDLPNVGVWSLGYENAAFKSRPLSLWRRPGFRGFAMPLTDRAKNVLLRLETGHHGESIGKRPLVFVTHSMGGLLVKQLLRTANESTNPQWQAILKRTRGVCFIATPHIGSDLAKWANYFRIILGTNVSMDELRPHEPMLLGLKEWYYNFVTREGVNIKTLSFFETKDTPGVGLVVAPGDADPGVPHAGLYPLGETHGSICTPASKEEIIYTKIFEFIKHDCFQTEETPSPRKEETRGQVGSRGEAVIWPTPGGLGATPRSPRLGILAGTAAVAAIGILLYNWAGSGGSGHKTGTSATSTQTNSGISYLNAVELMKSAVATGNWEAAQKRVLNKNIVWDGFIISSESPGYVIKPTIKDKINKFETAYVTLFNPGTHEAYGLNEPVTVAGKVSKFDINGINITGCIVSER